MPIKYSGNCEHCGDFYGKGSSPRFCSWECYKDSHWVERTCEKCGKTFKTRKQYVVRGQMKYCSPKCGQLASRTKDGILYDGIRFTIDANGYFVSSDGRGIKLHRYKWEKYKGKIPQGYLVHHKNHNKTDNRINNLSLEKWGEHTGEHSKERWKSGAKMGKTRLQTVCKIEGCSRLPKAKHLCTKHYQQMKTKERGRWL